MRVSSLLAVIAAATPLVMAAPSELDLRNVDCTIPSVKRDGSFEFKREADYMCLGKRELDLELRDVDCSIPALKREVEYFCLGKRGEFEVRDVDCMGKRETNYVCAGKRDADCMGKRETNYVCAGKRDVELNLREVDCGIPAVKREADYYCLGKREMEFQARNADCLKGKRESDYICYGK